MAQAPASAPARSLSPGRRKLVVVGIATALAAVAAAVWPASLHRAPFLPSPALPWWFYTLAFAAAYTCSLQLRSGGGEYTVSVGECPLIVGLFFAAPPTLLVGGLLGTMVVQLVQRRGYPEKIAFNLALFAAETAVAVTIFHAVAGSATGSTPIVWVATYAAGFAADLLSSLAIGTAIGVIDGELSLRALLRTTVEGGVTLPLVVSLSLVAATCLSLSAQSGWLLLVTGVGLLLAFRGYAALKNRRLNVQRLHRFSQAFGLAADAGDGLGTVLAEAREVLASGRAELLVVDADGALSRLGLDGSGAIASLPSTDPQADQLLFNLVVGTDTPVLLPRGSREPAIRRCLEALGARDALAAPLRAERKGVLLLADRTGDARTYGEQDLLLLETVANHVTAALRSGSLIRELRHEALHDPLTALPNRSLLQRRLAAALDDVASGRSPGAAVMLLDLDGFKQVNDSLGHHHGDLLLAEIGARLGTVGREAAPSATVARLGGDEFAVLVPEVADEAAAVVLGRLLLAALEPPVAIGGAVTAVGGSVGIALAPRHAGDATSLLKRADLAMYAAKVTGDGLRVYDERRDGALLG